MIGDGVSDGGYPISGDPFLMKAMSYAGIGQLDSVNFPVTSYFILLRALFCLIFSF